MDVWFFLEILWVFLEVDFFSDFGSFFFELFFEKRTKNDGGINREVIDKKMKIGCCAAR